MNIKHSAIGLISSLVIISGVYYFIPTRARTPQLSKQICIFTPVDFDISMQAQAFQSLLTQDRAQQTYNYFKAMYQIAAPALSIPGSNLRIPRILHVVWLGSKLPAEYEPFYISWLNKHPDWTVLFWTDTPLNYDKGNRVIRSFQQITDTLKSTVACHRLVVDTNDLQFDNKTFFKQTPYYGEKSDILKWEIVYQLGGVYVDIDHECLQPLDALHYTYDFYTGLQPLDTNIVQLGAALFAAIPNHPILKQCVEGIKYNQHIKPIVLKTGPLHFTQCFIAQAGKHGLKDIALPATYFYPCSYEQRGMSKDIWNRPEAIAIHHWAGSWLKPEAIEKKTA